MHAIQQNDRKDSCIMPKIHEEEERDEGRLCVIQGKLDRKIDKRIAGFPWKNIMENLE